MGDFIVANCNADGALVAHQDAKLFGACYGGVQQIALEHDVMLSQQRDDNGGELRTLRFVDGNCVS